MLLMPLSPMQMSAVVLAEMNIRRRESVDACRKHVEALRREMLDSEAEVAPTSNESLANTDGIYFLAERCHRCQLCSLAKAPWVMARLPAEEQTATTVVRLAPRA